MLSEKLAGRSERSVKEVEARTRYADGVVGSSTLDCHQVVSAQLSIFSGVAVC